MSSRYIKYTTQNRKIKIAITYDSKVLLCIDIYKYMFFILKKNMVKKREKQKSIVNISFNFKVMENFMNKIK